MTKVSIGYATDYGNTKKMAEAVASGVTSVPGTDVAATFADDVTEDKDLRYGQLLQTQQL